MHLSFSFFHPFSNSQLVRCFCQVCAACVVLYDTWFSNLNLSLCFVFVQSHCTNACLRFHRSFTKLHVTIIMSKFCVSTSHVRISKIYFFCVYIQAPRIVLIILNLPLAVLSASQNRNWIQEYFFILVYFNMFTWYHVLFVLVVWFHSGLLSSTNLCCPQQCFWEVVLLGQVLAHSAVGFNSS